MKTLLKIVGVILLLCIALIIAAPFLIPTDTIFNKVSEQVEKTTGRTLTIKGDKTLSVFPALKLELNDVHFANMQTGSRDDMASMEQLAVHIPGTMHKAVVLENNRYLLCMYWTTRHCWLPCKIETTWHCWNPCRLENK